MATAKVVIGTATVYHGDCLTVLRKHKTAVDIVITSPPYNQLTHGENGSGMFKGNSWVKKSANGYADNMPELEYQKMLRSVFGLCRDRTKGLMWINHKVRFRGGAGIHPVRMLPYPIYSEIIWDRQRSMAQNAKKFAPSHEGVWGFGQPHYWNDLHNAELSVWRIPPAFDKVHPCPFPIDLIAPLIRASGPVGGVVLDCFMGIGTTGVACIRTGRKFIGIEKVKKFFLRACKLIEKEYNATLKGEALEGVILGFLNGGERRYSEIATEFRLNKNAIYQVIKRLCDKELVKKTDMGVYRRMSK